MSSAITWNGISLDWVYSDLLSHIRYKVTCPHRAKDVLHDALIRFVVSPSQHRHEKPHAYLCGIVSHLIVNEFRYSARFIDIDTESLSALISGTGEMHSPEYLTEVKQRLCLLQQLINNLPKRCREAFWLFQVENMNQNAIASKMNISVNMVERHIIRAMLDLREAKEYLL